MNDLDQAAEAVAALDSQAAVSGAEDMAEAFEAAGARIARSLEDAAQSGKLSFEGLAESVLKDMARLAVGELVEAPLNALVGGLTQSLSGGGSRSAPTINLNVSGASDPQQFRRSEGQITASLARAVSLGRGRTA